MGYNSSKLLWQLEEVLISFIEKKIFKMQRIIFTEKCTVIMVILIKSISTDIVEVVRDLVGINATKLKFGVNVPIQSKPHQLLKNTAVNIMMNKII